MEAEQIQCMNEWTSERMSGWVSECGREGAETTGYVDQSHLVQQQFRCCCRHDDKPKKWPYEKKERWPNVGFNWSNMVSLATGKKYSDFITHHINTDDLQFVDYEQQQISTTLEETNSLVFQIYCA